MILFYDSQRSSQVSTVVEVSRDIFRVVDTVQKKTWNCRATQIQLRAIGCNRKTN